MKVSISDLKKESNLLIRLAMPILFAQLALTGLGVVDTIMSGRVGTDDLAAVGLGTNILLPIFIFVTGILLAITPMVSRAHGQNSPKQIGHFLVQGVWLSLPLGLLGMLLLMNLQPLLDVLELSANVYQLTEDYLFYIAFGMPGVAAYQALRFFWEGVGKTLPTMWISFAGLLLNIPMNYVFIYGYGPIEAMGAAGCGVASALVMWSMFVVGIIYIFSSSFFKVYLTHIRSVKVVWHDGIKSLLNLGVPNSLALLFEVGLFSFIILFIAPLGTHIIGAHQIAINATSLAFMVPLSFAMALTVRVGYGYGQQSKQQVRISLVNGFVWALLIGALMAAISFWLRFEIVTLYTFDPNVIALAASLLVFAAMYQICDAIQVTAAGALRGFHDTKVTMWVTLLSYWMIGLGLGNVFAFTDWMTHEPMGVGGFWLGIVLGLTLAAILLPLRLQKVYKERLSA